VCLERDRLTPKERKPHLVTPGNCGPAGRGWTTWEQNPYKQSPRPWTLQTQPGGRGVMCQGHCQVAGSQATGCHVRRRKWAAGQKWLPLSRLQTVAPFLSPTPYLCRGTPATSHAPAYHSLPGDSFCTRVQAGTPDWVEAGKTISAHSSKG
jgi:hypothetical protein